MHNWNMSNCKTLQILGIDAAVDPRNTGYAIAHIEGNRCRILHLATGRRSSSVVDQICDDMNADLPTLVALDAPLGWPVGLAELLTHHCAGGPIRADHPFNRETDRFVREQTGLKPLDVGADRIARTAVAALALVAGLRNRLDRPLPIVECPGSASAGGLIEVYPAATLRQHGLPYRRYKGSSADARTVRCRIAEALDQWIDLAPDSTQLEESDHILDAAICVLSAIDFLAGRCAPPPHEGNWQKEGWIWFRR